MWLWSVNIPTIALRSLKSEASFEPSENFELSTWLVPATQSLNNFGSAWLVFMALWWCVFAFEGNDIWAIDSDTSCYPGLKRLLVEVGSAKLSFIWSVGYPSQHLSPPIFAFAGVKVRCCYNKLMWSWSQKWTCEPGCHKLAELRQKGSSFRLLCHMHSGSVSCHCKQCSVWPALLPASASTWNIIHQDISFYNVMPLWLTCLAWESHPHAWHWHAQPASSSKFQRWQAIPNSQLLPGFNWETWCLAVFE